MAEYNINKGIGQSVEFKGLKAQYLFIFAGGLLAIFVLFVILFLAGVSQWVCIGTGVVSASLLVWQTFALNRRFGEYGLMKLMAKRSRPRFLINRKKPYQTIKNRVNSERRAEPVRTLPSRERGRTMFNKLNQRVNEKYPESYDH